jgi:predicted aspartyl protease
MRASRRLGISALLAIACANQRAPEGHAQFAAWTPADVPPSGSAEAPHVSRTVKLRFDLDGRPFPLPLVHGTVSGHPTWMLVDTGANSHVIAGWLARKVGLHVEKLGDVGTDHAGRAIPTFRVEHPEMAIDEWGKLADRPMLVTDVPEPIERLGIGAFVSPQGLGEGAAVVVDFPAGEMHLASYDDAQRDLGRRGRALSPQGGVACEDTESPIRGLAYVIPATIEGQRVTLLIDTGAQRTDLLLDSRAGRALLSRSVPNKEQMFAASGRIKTRTLKVAHVAVGEWTARADVDLIPGTSDPFCPRDGVVSMDLLGSCVIVLAPGRMFGRCGA